MAREQYGFQWKDYYRILEVDPAADPDAIVAAYRRMARAYHPDRNDDPGATGKFQEINEAKEVLTDPNRRSLYDHEYCARQRNEDFEEPTADSDNTYDDENDHWEEEVRSKSSGSDDREDQETYRGSQGSAYRWNHHRRNGGQGNQRSWEPGTWGQNRNYEPQSNDPSAGETEEMVHPSRHFLVALFPYLVDRFSPNPDETQRILPWPSWAWQRSALVAGIPLASLVFLISVAQGIWVIMIPAALWFTAALYSGINTRWMRASRQAEPLARFAAGGCIILSGVGYTLALAYAALIIAVLVAVFLIMGVILRAMLDQTMDR